MQVLSAKAEGELMTSLLATVFVTSILCHGTGVDGTNQDLYLKTPEFITKNGYPAETHTVTTADGYILEMHRIPYSPNSPAGEKKPVVFLQHGLFSSSADWIILGPGKSLGYLLADAGYDVWMGNARGNTYSRNHTTLNTSSYKFWHFSWHEMGIFDLPAELDYVLDVTGEEGIYYVGHSMGTTMFYVLMSLRPEYNSKVRHMSSLAPIAFMSHGSNALSNIAAYFPGGQIGLGFMELLGVGELLPSSKLMAVLSDNLCSDGSITQPVCSSIVFLLCGYDPDQINKTMLPVLLSHSPAGVSTRTIMHYAQEISSLTGSFAQWDYYALNFVMYKSLTPPSYDLSAITTPISLLFADNDPFGDPKDVMKLNQTLPNCEGLYRVPFDAFNHIDFMWAKDVKTLVNDEVIRLIRTN